MRENDLDAEPPSSPVLNRDRLFRISDAVLAEAIMGVAQERPITVGLCGSQGSGKSTTAARLARWLGGNGASVAICSLDDFYLTRGERHRLARKVHPLLATRGVPGTHDVALLEEKLMALLRATSASVTPLPIFDKASDERAPEARWRQHAGVADIVLLEGWCVGARPQEEVTLSDAVNELEQAEDADGVWRGYVNEQLATSYAALFEKLHLRLMLRAPSFDCVHRWRAEQEEDLRRKARSARAGMDDEELARFIAHYERLTRWLLVDEPADLIADLDESRVPIRWRLGRSRRTDRSVP